MWLRAIKQFDYPDQRGNKCTYIPGALVDVLNIQDRDRLVKNGLVIDPTYSHKTSGFVGKTAERKWVGLRIAFFTTTSMYYSGGRLHLYQYAWCCARLGAEVYLYTNRVPAWMNDYPILHNLHIVTDQSKVPADCDLVITDSKLGLGKEAYQYKQKSPHSVLIAFNFETPNWVTQYVPGYASQLAHGQSKTVYEAADMLISNSAESAKWLLEWLQNSRAGASNSFVLQPAVNTFALADSDNASAQIPDRPYAVFSGRGVAYKNFKFILDTIWSFDFPFDLVVFGNPIERLPDTPLHKLHAMTGFSDAVKYKLLKHARVACAPSLFEGYGMVPAEALASGTPALVFDLPVLRQEYGDKLIYAPWKDYATYAEELRRIASAPEKILVGNDHAKVFGMDAMIEKVQSLKFHTMDKRKVFAHLIAYWGFIPEALESVYNHVDEVLVAFGRDKHAPTIDDGSLDRLQAFPDPDNKIKINNRAWNDKLEMRNWCCSNSTGNYQLLLDGDEIWVGLDKWLSSDRPWGWPAWVNFWHGKDHWIHDEPLSKGTRWGVECYPFGSLCPHYRWSYWRRTYYFMKHPTPVDHDRRNLFHNTKDISQKFLPATWIAHLGHSLPKEVMHAKHTFYKQRDGDDVARNNREAVWHNWNGKTGECGDGIVKAVTFDLPDIVRRGFETLSKVVVR